VAVGQSVVISYQCSELAAMLLLLLLLVMMKVVNASCAWHAAPRHSTPCCRVQF